MLPSVFRIVLGFSLGANLFFYFRLVLNKFDIRHLHFRRRRNQEEKRKNQTCRHQCDVKQIRPTRRLRHVHDGIGIYLLALNNRGMVVGVAHTERRKREKQTDDNHRRRIAQAEVHHAGDKLFVRLHIEAERKGIQRLQQRLVEHQSQEDQEVDESNRQEEHALPRLAVVELT